MTHLPKSASPSEPQPESLNPCDGLPRKSAEQVPATNTSCDAGGESTAGNQSNSRGPSSAEPRREEREAIQPDEIQQLAIEMGNAGYCNYEACEVFLREAYKLGAARASAAPRPQTPQDIVVVTQLVGPIVREIYGERLN